MIKYFLALPILFLASALGAQVTTEALDSQGLNIQLPEVGLNLRVVDQNFRIYFLDEERIPLDPQPYTRAVLFTEQARGPKREDRLFLSPSSDGPFLVSPRIIAPPFDYWIRIVLTGDDVEEEVIARTRFQQETPEDLKNGEADEDITE